MEATAPHRLRGAIGWNARRTIPACRHAPAWRNTGLRTAATTSGVANYLAFCHRQRRDRHIGIPKQRSAESVPSPLRCEHRHCRNAANLFTTCNYAVVPGQHSIYHVRANDTPLPPTCILSLYPSRCKGSTEIIVKFGKNAQIGTKCRFFSFSGCNFVPGEGYYLEYLA